VRTVSTDGHRLALSAEPSDGLPDVTALLPLKSVKEFRGLLDEPSEADAGIVTAGETLFVTHAGMTLSIKTVAAQFPPYNQVIPQKAAGTAKVPRAAFRAAVQAVHLVSKSANGGVKVTFEAPGTVRVTSTNSDSGEGFDEVPGDVTAPAVLGLNAQYILDATAAMQAEEIEISFCGELDPIVIRPADLTKGSESLYVIMPMLL
jgi:DNA polymerase-3 subunit beta